MTAPANTQSEEKKRDNYTILPNMADDDLNIYEFRLLGHYTRVCGQGGGRCWQGIKTIHEKTGMSLGMITKTRKSLEAKGYIVVSVPDGKSRNRGASICVTIVDKWEENSQRYCKETRTANAEKRDNVLPQTILAVSPHETKNKKRYKKPERQEELKTTTTLPAVNPTDPAPENFEPGSSSAYAVPALTEIDLFETAMHGEPGQERYQPPEALAVVLSKPAVSAVSSAPPPTPSPPNTVPIDLQDNALGRIATLYHDNFGPLAPLISDAIKSRLDECGEKWVKDAIRETVFQGKRAWKYTDAILENWLLDGKQTLYAPPAATATPANQTSAYDDIFNREPVPQPDVPPVPDEPVDPLWQDLCRAVKEWSAPLFLDYMKKCSFGGFADGILTIHAPDEICGANLNHNHWLERRAEGIWQDFKSVNFIVKGVT